MQQALMKSQAQNICYSLCCQVATLDPDFIGTPLSSGAATWRHTQT